MTIHIIAPSKAIAEVTEELRFPRDDVRLHSLVSPHALEGLRLDPEKDRIVFVGVSISTVHAPDPRDRRWPGIMAIRRNLAKSGFKLEDVDYLDIDVSGSLR